MTTYYVWVLRDKLAVSPMPSLSDIPELAKVFNAVVILIEPHEAMGYIDLYLERWKSHGVEVYYAPTPDFHPTDLIELYRIVKWIDKIINTGGKVLVHCMGGIGRSGLVAASYLLYSGWSPVKTINYIRALRPGALESLGQEIMFHDLYQLLKLVDKSLFDKHLETTIQYSGNKLRHVSKTLQFTIELTDHLGIEDDCRRRLVIASLYHCLGRGAVDKLYSDNLLDKETYDTLTKYYDKVKDKEALILGLAHTLDKYFDSRIIVTSSELLSEEIIIYLYYDLNPEDIVDEANNYLKELFSITGLKTRISLQPYM